MDISQIYISKSAQETTTLGKTLGASLALKEGSLRDIRVLCLYGDLGAGKTTFTQGLAQGLGLTTRLLSPTFIIVRRHALPQKESFLYHLDLYRLQKSTELEDIGISEILHDNQSYVVIEWAEKLGNLLPSKRADITFTLTDEGYHTIDIQPHI